MRAIIEPTQKREFTIVTMAGHRYRASMPEVLGWFTNFRFYCFALISVILLILFAPHNKSYHLDMQERLVFWPVMTGVFIILYIICMWLGSIYATRRANRAYYSPIGILGATSVATYIGAFFVSKLTGAEPDLSLFKFIEVLFNMLLGCLGEGFHLAMNAPRLRKQGQNEPHEWENL